MSIKVNNINIHYEVIGERKEIILLNPNSINTNAMRFIADKLSKKFKVYIFDRRCCGKSEKNRYTCSNCKWRRKRYSSSK